jgi:hypothetical protein
MTFPPVGVPAPRAWPKAWFMLIVVATACAPRPEPAASAAAAATAAPTAPADSFLAALRAHCGQAYEGRIIDPQPADTALARQRLVMHVRSCSRDTIRIPFHVGDDRSRTWVLTRTADGIRLKHDHRHEDGTEDRVTQYGGDARGGTASRQEFPADAFTATLIPAAATNVWTVEVTPSLFAYQLRRESTDRRFRVEFDLGRPVAAPPAPWGATP